MQKLYHKIEELIAATHKLTYAARRQDYDTLNRTFRDEFILSYEALAQELLTEQAKDTVPHLDAGHFLQMTKNLLQAQEQGDFILLADYIELYIRPFLTETLATVREEEDILSQINYNQENSPYFAENACGSRHTQITLNEKQRYTVELTEQGPLTLRIERGTESFYLHSNVNPWAEAQSWADAYGEETAKEYAVLGLGLGYHAISLWNRYHGAAPIHVYETDWEVLKLARRYQDFTVCENRNFFIHFDPDLTKLSGKLKEKQTVPVIHYPSLRNIADVRLRQTFERFFVQDSSQRSQRKFLYANFNSNITANVKPVELLRTDFAERDVYIVAAGPSLDKNIELLKEHPRHSIILATGTVFRKLVRLGIMPDYVLITDANERVIWQVYAYRDSRIPLLVLSTACYRLCREYMGEKYIFFQQDFAPAEEYAAAHQRILFETGGSVSTTALDVCIRMGAARIIFLGLDLAFTDNLAHASGTSNRVATNQEELLAVRACDGGTVYSDYKFNIYADWIESRLRREDVRQIEVINATEGGRYIAGMEYKSLREVLQADRSSGEKDETNA